jgi:hypothetical protein
MRWFFLEIGSPEHEVRQVFLIVGFYSDLYRNKHISSGNFYKKVVSNFFSAASIFIGQQGLVDSFSHRPSPSIGLEEDFKIPSQLQGKMSNTELS